MELERTLRRRARAFGSCGAPRARARPAPRRAGRHRPYKPGLRLRTVLEILGRMKDEGHIDPDLFDVFVREKVYLRYAALALIENARDGARS